MRGQKSESLLLGTLLAAVGGFLEAYTFFSRGGVFANCQTGNLVQLALSLSGGRPDEAAEYLVPMLAFFAGVLLADGIRRRLRPTAGLHWRQTVLLAEVLCLCACAVLPMGRGDAVATILVAFVCAMQVEGFRKVRGSPFATTMCTGNLRSLSDQLVAFFHTGDRQAAVHSLRYLLIVLSFACGAATGGALTRRFAEKAVLFCCLPLLAGFGLLAAPPEKAQKPLLASEIKGRG